MTEYPAPWGKPLIAVSIFGTAIVVGVAALNWYLLSEARWIAALTLVAAPLLLGACLLFMVRGYRLDGANLYVRRLIWETAVDLRELESAQADPGAMTGSIRLFGNGGLFSFTGIFRNKRLGRYRAFVTDHRRAVVLRMAGNTVVVSPADPQGFVEDILARNA